ncbi:MAG: hypothetical protein KDE55_12960 [Novosphingobium sp.]|nr:hypothetical protein [Novosphingobium sp.]
MNIYRYVLASDDGMAPHIKNGIVTLATCKPMIRQTASEGDWVMGCFPSPNNEVVAWAGQIKSVSTIHDYGQSFSERDDALYVFDSNGNLARIRDKLPHYHKLFDEQRKDKKGNVLIFDEKQTWYFGADGRVLPTNLHHLAARGQGHRVNLRKPGDLANLIEWLRTQGAPGIIGKPRHDNKSQCQPCGSPTPKRRKKSRC